MFTKLIWKTFVATHIKIFRATHGRLWNSWGKFHFLLLTTTGRKTGQPRTVPLAYITDEKNNPIIIASAGGSPTHPAWYTNLEANSVVTVELPGKTFKGLAKVAPPELRETLWARLIAEIPLYAGYQKKTSRVIPMVILQPPDSSTGM